MTAAANIYAYVEGNPVSGVDPLGLLTLFGSLGGSYVAGYGGEGSVGVYLNSTDVDAGVFASGGDGFGLNVGVNASIGFYFGDVNNFRGPDTNFNWALGPIGGSNFYSDGKWQGSSIGLTPPGGGLPVGASASNSNTVAAGIRDLGKWMEKMRGGQSTFFPGMGKAKYPPRQPRRSNQTVCP